MVGVNPLDPPPMVQVRTDSTWQRPLDPPADGLVVVAGSPLRLFRLSAGGAQIIAMAEQGAVPGTAAVRQLVDRFVDAGALHPLPTESPFARADVTVVLPCHGTLPTALGSAALAGLRVVVVDDGSPTALAAEGVTVIRRTENGGPGAARNTGLAQVTTPLVAFVDADITLPDGWLAPLLPHFADDRVALVAARITGAVATGAVGEYEQRHCPLDLGDEPARIAAGTRVSYVPAAVLVCRVDALLAVGGFDETLRTGEDVDLVWRLAEASHRCRYEPAVVALHAPRPDLPAMARQRFGYGRSAAPLAHRHPGALAPVRLNGWSAAAWALVALRRPFLGLAVAAGTTVALVRKLADLPTRDAALLALRGHLAAGRQIARALRRVWWPLALIAAVFNRRARALVLAALFVEPLAETVRTRSPQPIADAPMALLDDVAYGAGVWAGVFAEREPGPLLPGISGWPPRGGQ